MNEVSNIAQMIQLSVAPVFLIMGIGAILSVVATRLGRTVDRARDLEDLLHGRPDPAASERMRAELAVLDRRVVYAQRSIALCSFAALLTCIVVAVLFVGGLAGGNLSALVAVLFIVTMFSLAGGLAMFLVEVTVATRMLRVRTELFMK